MSDLRAELIAAFIGERDDHLESIRRMLAIAERHGLDAEGVELDDIYRRAHSLKGAARAVDLLAVEAVAHRLETVLEALSEGRIGWDAGLARTTRLALDAIEDGSSAQLDGRDADVSEALEALERLFAEHRLELPRSVTQPADAPVAASVPARAQLRVDTEFIDALLRTGVELLTGIARQNEVAARIRDLRSMAAQAAAAPPRRVQTGRVTPQAERLGALVRAADALALDFEAANWELTQLSADLRDELTSARLLPVEAQFAGYPRMLRDLARGTGKQVRVETDGMAVRVDRAILQQSAEAVLHLLRNAIAHGIETPEERVSAGKAPEGRVLLHADVSGGRLHLRIEDDGRGLDEAALARRAVAAGIMTSSQATAAPGEALRELIFQSGFSTAGAVTEIAGRGMGMAIVRQVITRLHGELAIDSRPSRGTRFDLWLPATLVAQKLLLFDCEGQPYALPAAHIKAVEVVARDEVVTVEGRPFVRLRGRDVPLHALAALLGMARTPRGEALPVMLLDYGGGAMAVTVDALRAVEEWPVLPLPSDMDGGGLLTGTVTLSDGGLALVPNIPVLFRRAAGAPPLELAAPARRRETQTILVVDDSVTTRTLEKSTLEAHGYRVAISVNGLDALETLSRQPVDLIISDIEMPLMDGFALLKTVRGDKRLNAIPVILVTSRDSREDRERGLHLGADAYIVKKTFNQTDLLETIRQLLP